MRTNQEKINDLIEQNKTVKSSIIKDLNNRIIVDLQREERELLIKNTKGIHVSSTLTGGSLRYRVNGGRAKEYDFTTDELVKLLIKNGLIQ